MCRGWGIYCSTNTLSSAKAFCASLRQTDKAPAKSLAASATPVRRLPGAHPIAMAIIYVYVARIGATMDLGNADFEAMGAFILMAYAWIAIHGLFVLAGAWMFRVDVHTVAIASAANIGGAASAPIVAAHHRESLVPAAILMAMIGYALGNYLAILTGRLGQLIAGG